MRFLHTTFNVYSTTNRSIKYPGFNTPRPRPPARFPSSRFVFFQLTLKVDTPGGSFDESRTAGGRILTRLRFVHTALHRDGAETEATTHVDATHAHTRLHDWYERTSSRRRQTHARTRASSSSSSSSSVVKQHSRGAWIHHPSKRRDASSSLLDLNEPTLRFGSGVRWTVRVRRRTTKDDASIYLGRVRTGKGDGTRRT